jgi:hypothetical protein
MDSTIFRAALRASAKVALTATLGSCGGTIDAASREARDGSPPPPVTSTLADASTAVLADVAAPGEVADAADASLVVADVAPPPVGCDPLAAGELFPKGMHGDAGVTEPLFECCVTFLGSAIGTDASWPLPMLPDAEANDPNILGCCAVAVYHLDSVSNDRDASVGASAELANAGVNTYECCQAIGYPVGVTCTPWGPPMPPAMPEVA